MSVASQDHFAEQEAGAGRASGVPELVVVVPTLNEAGNVAELSRRLAHVLGDVRWEAVFVDDDSTDATRAELLELANADSRIRFIHRIGRRGLSSAVVEGALASQAPIIAVMDSDLQHDETRLPAMLDELRRGEAELVVGTRYADGGGVGDWDKDRQRVSNVATALARFVLPVPLSDPMSGFFMLRRPLLERSVRRLSQKGYKILLDVVLSADPPPKVAEVSYEFRTRQVGESKLDAAVALEYLTLLIDKTVGHIVPARFVLFGAVGAVGVIVHFAMLSLALAAGLVFTAAQAVATVVAMTFNFFVNNNLTYRDKRLRGLGPVLRGLASFYAACAIGAFANVGVASALFGYSYAWWLSALAGIAVGVVWNYAITSIVTWQK